LPSGALARLLPKLHAVALPVRRTLLVPQERIEAVYFVESGWVSMVAHLDDGTQADVGLVGFEGIIDLPLVVGVDSAGTSKTAVWEAGAACSGGGHVMRQLNDLKAGLSGGLVDCHVAKCEPKRAAA
jgi:hypothetical protein